MENLPTYKFRDEKWVSADELQLDDIALVINKADKSIYIWDGPDSRQRDQIRSKNALGDFKIEFPDYKFRLIKDVSDKHKTPKFVRKTIKVTTKKDTERVKNQIISNKVKLERFSHRLTTLTVLILLSVIGILLRYVNADYWRGGIAPGSVKTFFPTNSAFTNIIQTTVIMTFIAGFCMIGLLVIAKHLGLYERLLFDLLGVLIIFLTISIYWEPSVAEMIDGPPSAPFTLNVEYFHGFLMNSVLLMFLVIILVLIGMFVYRYEKEPKKTINNKKKQKY